jgi:hypothetical protein
MFLLSFCLPFLLICAFADSSGDNSVPEQNPLEAGSCLAGQGITCVV